MKNKAGLYVADLDLILHHHWVLDKEIYMYKRLCVQMAPIAAIAGATSTQPGALIGTLRYKYIEFHVFPLAPRSRWAHVGLVLTLNKIKCNRLSPVDGLGHTRPRWTLRRSHNRPISATRRHTERMTTLEEGPRPDHIGAPRGGCFALFSSSLLQV